jgi:hypothetical protein
MNNEVTDAFHEGQRKRVRRTVVILVSIVAAFFALSFVQIVLMK